MEVASIQKLNNIIYWYFEVKYFECNSRMEFMIRIMIDCMLMCENFTIKYTTDISSFEKNIAFEIFITNKYMLLR